MDISSTSSSAATVSTAEASSSSQAQKSSKSDSSFKDEMNKVSSENKEENKASDADKKVDEKNETQNNKVSDNDDNAENSDKQTLDLNQAMVLSGEINMSAVNKNNLANKNGIQDNFQVLMNANRQLAGLTSLNDSQIPAKVDYSNIDMGADDAKFFADLVQNTDKTLQSVTADLQGGVEQNVQQAAKNVKVSATLMNALNEAVKTNRPFRINFDKDVSVIIKVDKDGALSATFIPGDKAVEEYLKQNISFLRQRFDEQELSYKDLSYSRQKQNQEQNRRNNKENDNE